MFALFVRGNTERNRDQEIAPTRSCNRHREFAVLYLMQGYLNFTIL